MPAAMQNSRNALTPGFFSSWPGCGLCMTCRVPPKAKAYIEPPSGRMVTPAACECRNDVIPRDIRAGRLVEDRREGLPVLTVHEMLADPLLEG